eukprot:1282525-Amphidinium_carterae.1
MQQYTCGLVGNANDYQSRSGHKQGWNCWMFEPIVYCLSCLCANFSQIRMGSETIAVAILDR